MENKSITKFDEYFTKVLPLSYINARITFTDFPFPLFTEINELKTLPLESICNTLVTIASKVHDCLMIDFHFSTKPSESSKLWDYQMILTIVYSIIKDSIGINNKQVLIRFPQLVDNQRELQYDIDLTFSFRDSEQIVLRSSNETLHLFTNNTYSLMIAMINDLIESNKAFRSDYITYSYDSVCFGGSFDHYHIGHNILILSSTIMSKKSIIIGVTSDEMLSNKNSPLILQPCNYRIKHINKVLSLIGSRAPDLVVNSINDPVSFSGTKPDLQALLITGESAKGGDHVNSIRKQNNVPLLDLLTLNVIGGKSNDYTLKVSSSGIRNDILSKISIDDLDILHSKWKELMILLGIKNLEEKIEYWWSIIRDHYMESWRYYHTLSHVLQMLNTLTDYSNSKNREIVFIELLLSIWFHDIIYIPSRNDNEERSVDLMKECLGDLLSPNDLIQKVNINKIAQYIIETKTHLDSKAIPNDDESLKLFLDLDMSVFTLEKSEVKQYQSNIKKEYFFASQADWVTNRGEFLKKLKSKQNIYHTSLFISKQAKAIENIDMLINLLDN